MAVWLLVGQVAWCAEVRAVAPEEMVKAHNAYRAKVGSAPLSWSKELANNAEAWAKVLIERGTFEHQKGNRFGENLYEIDGGTATARQVVDGWASEAAEYDRAANTCSGRCGHYTQVIWGGTKRVGCGAARTGEREVWVCEYDPPGNVIGERP